MNITDGSNLRIIDNILETEVAKAPQSIKDRDFSLTVLVGSAIAFLALGYAFLNRDHFSLNEISKVFYEDYEVKCLTYLDDKVKVPVISFLGGIDQGIPRLPKIDLTSIEDLLLREDIIEKDDFYKRTAYEQFSNLTKKTIALKETADLLVKALKNESSFGWEYIMDGCSQRALLAYSVLQAMGIPDESRMIKRIIGKHSGLTFCDTRLKWGYHDAAAIKLTDGTQLIIDPSTDPEKAQTLSDWIEKSGFGPSEACEESDTYEKECVHASVSTDEIFAMRNGSPCRIWKVLESNRKHLQDPTEGCIKIRALNPVIDTNSQNT